MGENTNKPGYITPKVSRLDSREPYFGGEAGPDDCTNNGSNAADGCSDGSNAAGINGAGCAEGFNAATWCNVGSDGEVRED